MKKGDIAISPIIIVVLALVFGVIAMLYILGALPTAQGETLAIINMFL